MKSRTIAIFLATSLPTAVASDEIIRQTDEGSFVACMSVAYGVLELLTNRGGRDTEVVKDYGEGNYLTRVYLGGETFFIACEEAKLTFWRME